MGGIVSEISEVGGNHRSGYVQIDAPEGVEKAVHLLFLVIRSAFIN